MFTSGVSYADERLLCVAKFSTTIYCGKEVIFIRHITVVDARMGRGKSSAAIRYMNERAGERCFLYITPYLSEVDRVCELCDFEEPGCDYMSKSAQLKAMLKRRCNIASTHALFTLMDDEALELAGEKGYDLIIDESLQVIQGVPVSPKDMELLLNNLMTVGEDGRVTWLCDGYEGKFAGYKEMADEGSLYYRMGTFYEVMNPKRLLPFGEAFMLTYLFDGQLQKAYFDYYGFDYDVVGIETDGEGYRFSDRPDRPPPADYSKLIRILESDEPCGRMNSIGNGRTALSVNWFKQRSKGHEDIKNLKNCLYTFFERRTDSTSERRLWTTFKDYEEYLLGARNRYASNFLALNARATNAYKNADCVAYLANRFINPNIAKFFADKGITVDADLFALSEMLQFIWRSAIRDGKPIRLYIPSRRMRELLIGWIQRTNSGGANSE